MQGQALTFGPACHVVVPAAQNLENIGLRCRQRLGIAHILDGSVYGQIAVPGIGRRQVKGVAQDVDGRRGDLRQDQLDRAKTVDLRMGLDELVVGL